MSIENDLTEKINLTKVLAAEAVVVKHLEEAFFNRLYTNDPLPDKQPCVINFDQYKKNRPLRWKRKIATTT